MTKKASEPLEIFYSYAHEDEALRNELEKQLKLLQRQGYITQWYDREIRPGSFWEQEIDEHLQSAQIILLLVSPDFIASDYCYGVEMQEALKRHAENKAHVIPVILRRCDWESAPFGKLQALPKNAKPVRAWSDRDAAFTDIVKGIRGVVTEVNGDSPVEVSQTTSTRRENTIASEGVRGERVIDMPTIPNAPMTPVQRTNRQRLLKRVRTIWIEGLLEQSIHHATWVDLHLQMQPQGLESPWRLMVQELDRGPRPLPPGTSIIQVFDEADEELLILGEPGSGKTTLLLYLARTLLDRAQSDERRRIPVIFNLSSWAQQQLPLSEWLTQELKIRYQVPQQIGRAWVEANEIFPLLDGLDEVAESVREACVQAITSYAQREHDRIPLIVCCRIQEYQALSGQLPLQYAVMLLPFTDEQIEVYLSSVSGRLDTLRQVLREDKELFELARLPLMLSIFTQAYHGEAFVDLPATVMHEEYPRALFKQYVKRMLTRRTQVHLGTEEQFRRWLTYFAAQLHRQQQTIFAVEELQPAWLPERYRSWYRWSMILAYGLTFGLLFGPAFGLAFGFVYGLIFHTLIKLAFGVVFGLVLGVIGGVSGGLVFGLVYKYHQIIQPAEIAVWSPTSARKGLLVGALGGLVFSLVGALVGWVVAGPMGGVVLGCVVEGIMVPVGGLIGGLSPTQLPERMALSPNEGIWRSGRRGVFAILLLVLVVGLAGGLMVGLLGTAIGNLVYALMFGLVFGSGGGLIFGLFFDLVGGRTGLAAFLQHFVLRFFLWRLGLLPWNLVAFLDEATERLLLRKVGGSYIFVHRLLRDVLATQNDGV